MRGLALLVLVAAPAFADKKLSLPDIVKEAQTPDVEPKRDDRFPGIDGSSAAGHVIAPPRIGDEAMAMMPPDVNDPIALELGTNQLRNRIPRTSWLPRDLSLGAKRAADAFWDLLLPQL